MALVEPDLSTLAAFIATHPINEVLTTDAEIVTWLDSNPTQNYANVINCLSYDETSDFFLLKDVNVWYAGLNQKFKAVTDTPVTALGIDDFTRRKEVRKIRSIFINDLVEMNLKDLPMHALLTSFSERSTPENPYIQRLFFLFVADGLISNTTLWRLNVEFNPLQKRWEQIPVSSVPEESDLPTLSTTYSSLFTNPLF